MPTARLDLRALSVPVALTTSLERRFSTKRAGAAWCAVSVWTDPEQK